MLLTDSLFTLRFMKFIAEVMSQIQLSSVQHASVLLWPRVLVVSPPWFHICVALYTLYTLIFSGCEIKRQTGVTHKLAVHFNRKTFCTCSLYFMQLFNQPIVWYQQSAQIMQSQVKSFGYCSHQTSEWK